MLGSLKRMVGLVGVQEKNNVIYVTGIPADTLARHISKIWTTSRINSWMFRTRGRSDFSFNSFFAPDIVYMLRKIEEERLPWMVRRSIEKIIEGIARDTWYRQTQVPVETDMDYGKLRNLNVSLLPHQSEFLDIYRDTRVRFNLKGYVLSAAPGSGKTINTLALAEVRNADLTICVCPKNAVTDVWAKTVAELYKKTKTVWTSTSNKPYAGEEVIIAHYEQIPKLLEYLKYSRARRPVVILDESHNLNEIDRVRTLAFVELCKVLGTDDVIWASGTPFKAMSYECIPILRTIDPLFDKDAEQRFRQIFGRNAARGLDIVAHRIGRMSFKVAKTTIQKVKPIEESYAIKIPNGHEYTLESISRKMSEFIEARRKFYQTTMRESVERYEQLCDQHERTLTTEEQRADYRRYRLNVKTISRGFDPVAHKDLAMFCNWYEKNKIIPSFSVVSERHEFKELRTVIKYVELKIVGEALGRILGRERVQCHLDMLPHMELEKHVSAALKKTVIFTSYVQFADAAADQFRQKGFTPLVVHGGTNKDFVAIIKEFFENPDANPLIATFQSLSTAVPLIAANEILFTNQPFRDHMKQQAQARVDRIGQDTQTYFRNLFLDTGKEGNISTRSKDILEWSQRQVSVLMGHDAPAAELEIYESYSRGLEQYGEEWDAGVYQQSLISLEGFQTLLSEEPVFDLS